MKIDQLFESAKRDLDACQDNIRTNDYYTALVLLGNSYGKVRTLLECVWRMKRESALAANPPGENSL